MKKIVFGAVCAAVLVPFAAPAQAAPDGAGGPAGPTVTYFYVGPATAPQYHQEYVIEVREGVATAKVGGYGTVDGTARPAKTQSKRLDSPAQRALVQAAPSIPAFATGTPCPGAATYRLTYRNPGSEPKRTVAYTCASGDRGDVAALARYIEPVANQLDVLPRLTFTVTG